jgi:hypothetical protein
MRYERPDRLILGCFTGHLHVVRSALGIWRDLCASSIGLAQNTFPKIILKEPVIVAGCTCERSCLREPWWR